MSADGSAAVLPGIILPYIEKSSILSDLDACMSVIIHDTPYLARFVTVTAVHLKFRVFYDMTQCRLVSDSSHGVIIPGDLNLQYTRTYIGYLRSARRKKKTVCKRANSV